MDAEEVLAGPEDEELEADDDGGVGEGDAEELGLEAPVQAGEEGGQEDVGREGHEGDVHVGGVEVLARGQEVGRGAGAGVRARGVEAGLLPGPRAVPPGEEDDEEFGEDVGVGDVEVVLQLGDVDVAVELGEEGSVVLAIDSHSFMRDSGSPPPQKPCIPAAVAREPVVLVVVALGRKPAFRSASQLPPSSSPSLLQPTSRALSSTNSSPTSPRPRSTRRSGPKQGNTKHLHSAPHTRSRPSTSSSPSATPSAPSDRS